MTARAFRRGVGTDPSKGRLPRRECSNVHDRATAARCQMPQNDAHSEPAADDTVGLANELRQRRVPVAEQLLSAASTSSDKGVSG